MVIRMRIYASQNADHRQADAIFYQWVKPVHERHGAEFLGRVVVLWRYASEAELRRIQSAVAADPETLQHRELRLAAGLHGLDFTEHLLYSTAP